MYAAKHGQAELVRRLGWRKETIFKIVSGVRLPTPVQATVIVGEAWLGAASTTRQAPGVSTPSQTPKDPKEVALSTVATLEKAMAELNADPTTPVKEKAQLATALTSATKLLAVLSGSLEITESTIIKSAAFARWLKIVTESLRPFPDAMRACLEACERFEKEGK
jgi:hypothetical protein